MKSLLAALIALDAGLYSAASAAPDAPVIDRTDPASALVNEWFTAGKAAGLEGVLYDNRDGGHSKLGITAYPQLKPLPYTEDEIAKKLNWGGQRRILPGLIVIGNSSTASPAHAAGSHQRIYYTQRLGPAFLFQQYRTNALYVYPEHRDHDPGTNGPDGCGDLYPANSPYLISSQGSSGSDRAFLHAVLKTVAAFPKETREYLDPRGLLMPTVQAIFRQTYKAAPAPDDYFTGKAHPSAFDGKLIDEAAMVKLAQSTTRAKIPPLVQLQVLEESVATPGVDFFEPEGFRASERLTDTPCAIARVVRGPDYQKRIRISAARSIDPGERPLTFRWEILRGDPRLITIEPVGENREEAVITVAYHPRRPISPGSSMWSNRVDIGVFALAKGALVSPPAFVSFTTLPNEHRTYTEDGRLLEIFYAARSLALGIPPTDGDGWDILLDEFENHDSRIHPRAQLLDGMFAGTAKDKLGALAAQTKPERARLAVLMKQLNAITTAQQWAIDAANKTRLDAAAAHKRGSSKATKAALDAATAKHNAARKVQREGAGGAAKLKTEIAERRAKVAVTIESSRAPAIVRSVLGRLRDDPQFFSRDEKLIRAAAADPGIPKAKAVLRDALARLEEFGVSIGDQPAENELYHLRLLNIEILSGVLLPGFLQRPHGVLYADPRLTAPKRWRDVYHYDKDGNLAGWTRWTAGKSTDYTARGEVIRSRHADGSPDDTVEVRYELNEKSRTLDIVPVK